MLRKSEFNLKSALSALKDRGQGGDARQSSRKLTVILSTVLAVAILATVVVVSLPGSRAMAATSSGVITSVYGESVIPSHYNAMNVPAGTYLMTKDNYTSGTVTQSTDGVASFDFHIFADRFSSGVHTCGNIAVNLLGADVLGNAAAPEFGSRSSHDIDVPKLSYVGDLYGWSAATTNEYLVFGHDVDVTGNGQVWVELANGGTAMMGNDNGGSLLDTIYIENNGNPVEAKDGYLYIQGELDEAEDYQRWLIWLMEQANAENGNKNSKYATTITQSDGSTESVQYLHYNDLVSWNYWGWSSPNLDFSSYDADTIVIDLPTYQGYDWWTYQQVTYSYALQMIYNTVQMTGTAGKRIVFNICTDGIGDNFSFFSTTMSADNLSNSEGTAELDNNILWNFYETGYDSKGNEIPVSYDGVISVSGTWVGSILAPDATVSCGAGLNGSIIAKNVVTFCETHKSDYTGERVTQTTTSATVTKVWRDDPSMRPAYITIQLLRNGEVVNSIQMTSSNASADDANVWTYTFTDLPATDTAGSTYQYKFAEIVPSGYEMEQVGNTIINTSTSVPETIVPTYELTVYKTDGSTNLSGASLMLTSNSGANLSSASVANASSSSVTDSAVTWVSSGTPAVISGLPAGSYTVTETSAPSGYKVAASQNVTISGSGEITVVNTPITVIINKYNGENDYKDQLPGASFELKANWGTTLSANMVSGASAELKDYKLYWTNGTSPVTLSGIPAGSYTLTELTAPDGFDLAAPVTFIVYSDGSIYVNNQLVSSVDVYNYLVPTTEQVYNLTVNKTGGASANALAGADMVLTNVAGKNLEEYKDSITVNGATCTISGSTISWTTGSSAVTFNGLPAGNYVLTETSAPDGYKKAADISITLNADSSVTMHDASIELNISKLDSLSGAQLTGAQLTLTEDNGADLSGVTSSTVTLSKNGSTISWTSNGKAATFTNLPAGTYTLTESDAPSGYSEAGQQKFKVDEYGNVTNVSNANISGNTVTMYDAPVTLDISKIYWNDALGKTEGTLENGETGTLSGAKLQLTANVSLANVTGSITVNHTDDYTLTWISGSKANTLRGLPDGTYTLSEIEAPAGYDAANAIAFTVSGGKITACTTANTGDAYSDTSVTMCDKKTIYYSVKISKVDAETEDALSGATIGIFPAGTTSFVADNAVLVFNSSSAPEQMILANGDYILRELSAPEGYDLNDECICFNVNNGNVKITEVYTPTANINIGNPLESYEGLNWFADYVQFYTDITDYVAANNNMPPDKILVKIPSANSTEDIMTEITAYTVYLDANNQGVAGSHANIESSWATGSTSPDAAVAGGTTTYVNNYSDGYDYYYITNFAYPNVDNVPVTDFGRGDYSTALLLLDVTGYQRYTSSESLWSSLGATVSIFYGDKEVVLGEKNTAGSGGTGSVEAKSAFSYGVVPVASWASFEGNYLYADITDLVTANEGWPTSITFSTNEASYATGISDLPTTLIFGNNEVANWNNTIFPSNYASAWAGADGVYSYVVDCSSTNIDYADYAAEDHSADRIYMVISEVTEDQIDLYTIYLEDILTPTLTFANGKTVVMEAESGSESETADMYYGEFADITHNETTKTGLFVDITDILTEYESQAEWCFPYTVTLTRSDSEDNVEVTNFEYYYYFKGTDTEETRVGRADLAISVTDGVETITVTKSGSLDYDSTKYSEAYLVLVTTVLEEDGTTTHDVVTQEEWEALGFDVEFTIQGVTDPVVLGSYSSTPIEKEEENSGVLNPSDVTITGDASSGEPVIITLPNRVTPVADRYVYSVQLNKVDQAGNAITGNPATFLLYDSKGNPVRLSGSDGSYQFVYDAAGEIICEQADFVDGTATKEDINVSQLPAAINYELGALVDGLKLSATITSSNGNSVTLPTIAPTSVNGSWKNIDLSALGVTGGDNLTVTLTQTYADGQSATKAELDFVYPLTTSQAAGTIRVDNLELGDYYFVETEAPTNYKCDTGSINFTLTEWNTSDNPAKINAFNTELTGSLIIEKTDDTGRPLSGAQFVLYVGSDIVEGDEDYEGLYRYDNISVAVNKTYDKNGIETVGTYTFGWIWGSSDNNVMTTGTDGKILITGLPLGHVYYVQEITAAPGTSNSNAGMNLPALTVGSSTVEGTAYYDESKLYGTALGEDITTYVPTYTWNDADGDGVYEEGELAFEYVAEQVTTYDGVISVTNKAFTTTINKVGEDNAFLPGAQLKLEPISDVDLSGVSGTTTVNGVSVNATLNSINEPILDGDGNITGYLFEYVSITWESGSDSMVLRGLPSGFYKLTEEKAPTGYAVAAPIYIYIDESGNAFYSVTESTDTAAYTAASSNTVTMTDKKLTGTITLVKRDGTTNERISGVQFVLKCGDSYVTVTESNGKYIYTALAASGTTMTTAADGTIVVEGLPYGTTYTFVETVPAGYSVASTDTSVELTATELSKEITVTNDRVNNGSITLIKTEKGTNTGLANAVFDLYSRKAGSGAAFTLHSSGHTTGSDGKVTVNNLAWGYDYKFVETAAADGYDKNTAASDTEFVTINSTTTGAVEYKVTNEKLLSLKVVKSWDDNGDQDGARPDSVEVKLYADGSEYASATLNSGNNWTHVFTGLPVVTESGSRISYSVDEPSVPAGYSKTGPVYDDQNGQWVITNSHTTATTGITVTKKWNDSSNQDGMRPESVKVQLKANGTASGAEIILNETNNWTYTWENLAVNAGGAAIAYTVEEVSVPSGYTAEVTGSMTDGFVITNTHTVLTTDISVSKSWNDSDNQDGIRPSSVTVQLMAGDTAVGDEITLNADNNWSYTWTGLAVNAGGTAINYTVVETNVKEGYTAGVSGNIANGFVITNSHNTDVTSVSVRKNWNDANNQDGIRPSSVQVQLKANGTAIGDPVTLNSDNSWAYTWSDLALNAGGSAVAYTVEEVTVPDGYSASVSGSMAEGFVITNTHATATTGISVTKVWDDKNNQDGNRPGSVTVQLMAGSDAYGDEITLDSSNNWTYTWSGLAVNAGGSAINYTVVETNVATGYTATVSGSMTEGYTITNSYTPAVTSVSVEKVWNDNSNQDGLRTDSVTVQLKANGTAKGDAVTLNADNNWKYTWTGLDKNSGGNAISYTVEELNVPTGYTATVSGDAATGYKITNFHATANINVSVNKVWSDNNDQDGKRTDYVTVQLMADGIAQGDEITLNADNNWTYTWDDLAAKKDGADVVYTVVETNVPAGYTSKVTGSIAEGFTVTNTHDPETTDISVTKEWIDGDDQDGLRPGTIIVKLLANGEEAGIQTNLSKANGWSFTWTDLPVYSAGSRITYTVVEAEVPAGYTAQVTGNVTDGFVAKNTHTPEVTDISVTKSWVDSNDQDGIRPTSVQVQLKANGTAAGAAVTLNADNSWAYTWEDMAVYADGTAITYTVEEVTVPDGYTAEVTGSVADGFTVTNTHATSATSITVSKSWSDADNQDGIRPSSVTVQLKANGTAQGDEITLNADNSWTYTWSDLAVNADGAAISYTVEETNVPTGYTATVSGSAAAGYIITNSHTPEVVDISVEKSWSDANNQDGKRTESVSVQLKADGVASGDPVTLNKDNNWTYTWPDLDKFSDGDEIAYTVEEVNTPDGYTAAVKGSMTEGFEITNSYTPAVTDISVTKEWVDNNDQDGKRTDSVTVQLMAGNTAVGDEITLNADNSWTYIWEDLAVKASGDDIVYSVVETNIPEGYTASYSGSVAEGFKVTNTHTPAVTNISVTKEWVDANDQDGLRSGSVIVKLLADGKEAGIQTTLSKANGWSFTWNKLPVYSAGVAIEYTVAEVSKIDGYTSEVTGSAAAGFVITNRHTPETTDISVEKVWEDKNDQDGIRPTSVTVQLKANGTAVGDVVTLNKDNDWSYTWNDLAVNANGTAITYTVEETAVSGYTVSYTGSVAEGFTVTNTHNPNTTTAVISKVDVAGSAELPGATLILTPAEGVDLSGVKGSITVTYNEKNGTISWVSGTTANTLTKLPIGEYTLTEITAPDGYEVAESITFSVDVDGNITIGGVKQDGKTVVMEDAPITVTISKQDINGTNELPGATLVITPSDENTDLSGVMGTVDVTYNETTGTISWVSGTTANTLTKLPAGEYTLTEITAPDGYEVAENITFVVNDKGEVTIGGTKQNGETVIMKDAPITVTISKQDINGTNELPGATLVITPSDENTDLSGVKGTVDVTYNEETGTIGWVSGTTANTLTKLPAGEYTLTEITAPDGYEVAENITFVVNDKGEVTIGGVKQNGETVVMKDAPITVTISKQDINGTDELPGATLVITPSDENTDLSGVKGTVDVTYDETTGTISWVSGTTANTLTKLPAGEYTLTEITAPDGYEVAENITFVVNDKGEVNIGGVKQNGETVVMKDAPRTVIISKQDINGTSELPGATLVITPSDENTDLSGVKGTVDVTYDETTGTISWVSGTTSNTLTKLPAGEYTLTEITAPDGYEVAENITFVVNDKGEVTIGGVKQNGETVIMKDAPRTVIISKQDINGTSELPGATLVITPSDENTDLSGVKGTVDVTYNEETGTISWVSGTTSNTLTKLPIGEYTLTEITAPDGYEVAENITFVVNDKGEVTIGGTKQDGKTVIMKDAPITVTISKQDINGTSELPGATLVITPSDENTDLSGVKGTVDVTYNEETGTISWVSGTTSNTLTKLPAGEYTLTEITAPDGYAVAENITFVVNDKGEVTIGGTKQNGETVIMKDAPLSVTISKQDINGTDELPGATLVLETLDDEIDLSVVTSSLDIDYDEDENTITWVSGDEMNVLSKLPAGAYTLTEITAPDGYQVAEDITFTVNEKGEVYVNGKKQDGGIVVMKDAPLTITISKQDINGTDELPGATLVLTPADEDTDLSGVTASLDITYNKETGTISWVSGDKANELSKLPAGEYTLTELTAPNGYTVAEDIEFTVDEDGVVRIDGKKQDGSIVVMKDVPNEAVISKQAVGGGDELVGAELTVVLVAPEDEKATLKNVTGTSELEYSADGSSITWISGSTANTLTCLPDGVYSLVEVAAPAGYKVATSMFFKVDNGVVYNTTNYTAATTQWTKADKNTVIMYDERISVAISFVKSSNLDKPLAGAVFTLTDANGKTRTATSGTNGIVSFDNLEQGTYTLSETTAPSGYVKSTKTVTVNIDSTGTVVWRDSTGYQILVADVEDEFTNKFQPEANNPQNDLTVGDKVDLSDNLPDELGGVDVEWDSSDDSIASVDQNGNVTILKPGQVTITVTYKGDVVDSFVLGATSQNNSVPETGSDLVRIGMYVSAALLGAFGATTAVVYGVKRRRQNQA